MIILDNWDEERIKIRQDGDPDSNRIPKKERKSRELFNTLSDDYVPPKDSSNHDKVEGWVTGLADDASFNSISHPTVSASFQRI